jgi:hypothetical protein
MSEFLTLHTFIAFVLGVLMAAMVKQFVSTVRSKAGV